MAKPALPATDDGKVHRCCSLQVSPGGLPTTAGAEANIVLPFAREHDIVNGPMPRFSSYGQKMLNVNSDLLLMPYEKSVQWADSGATLQTPKDFNLSMYAKLTTGAYHGNSTYNVNIMYANRTVSSFSFKGITATSWKTWFVPYCESHVLAENNKFTGTNGDPIKGVWHDSAGDFTWQTNIAAYPSGTFTHDNWNDEVWTVGDHNRSRNPDWWIWANGFNPDGGPQPTVGATSLSNIPHTWLIGTHFDGVMAEGWVKPNPTSATPSTDAQWQKSMNGTIWMQTLAGGTGTPLQVLDKCWGPNFATTGKAGGPLDAAKIHKIRKLMVASYYITNRGKLYMELSRGTITGASNSNVHPWGTPALNALSETAAGGKYYTTSLGTPQAGQSPATIAQHNVISTLYARKFTGGIALVNTSASATVNYANGDGRTYTDIETGTTYPNGANIPVPAQSGLLLTTTITGGTPPTVVSNAATSVTSSGATISGTVNPNGSTSTYQFEYGTTTAYGSKIPVNPAGVGAGSSPVAVTQTLTGLPSATLHHYRLSATGATGVAQVTADRTFTTSTAIVNAPIVTTSAATTVTDVSATLNGNVNPNSGGTTTYHFEYGTTSAYGTSTPNGTIASIPSAVNAPITGLVAGTTYFWRLVASNGAGTDTAIGTNFVTTGSGAKALPVGLGSRPSAVTTSTGSNFVMPPESRAGTVRMVWLDIGWGALQNALAGPILSSNPLDTLITQVQSWNTAHTPANQKLAIGVRVYAGHLTPQAIKDDVGVFSWSLSSPDFTGSGTTPKWWSPQWRVDYKDFITKLGAKYDGVAEVAVVNVSTVTPSNYPEAMIKHASQATFRQPMWDAGYDWQADLDTLKIGIDDTAKAFPRTYVAITLNPNQKVTARDTWTDDNASSNEIMDYARDGGLTSGSGSTQKQPMRGLVRPQANGVLQTAYIGHMSGTSVYLDWNKLQSTNTSTLSGTDVAALDTAIANARANGLELKIRLFCGAEAGNPNKVPAAPSWLTAQTGTFKNADQQDSAAVPTVMARFWVPAYATAYDNLMKLMAARWDNTPEIRDITISGAMFLYAEPFIRSFNLSKNRAELVGGGIGWTGTTVISPPGADYSDAKNKQYHKLFIDSHAKWWLKTNSSLAFNPYQILKSQAEAGIVYANDNQVYDANDDVNITGTKEMIDYFKAKLGTRGILENNSLRPDYFTYSGTTCTGISHGTTYGKMYDHMNTYGNPNFYQTANENQIATATGPGVDVGVAYTMTMDAAIRFLKANAVEPVPSYAGRPEADFSPANFEIQDNKLKAIPTGVSGGGGGVPGGGYGKQIILMNSSARDNPNFAGPGQEAIAHTHNYWPMYDYMIVKGNPIYIQEATAANVGSPVDQAALNTANWADVKLLANSVELQANWVTDTTTYPQSAWSTVNTGLLDNPTFKGAPPPPPPADLIGRKGVAVRTDDINPTSYHGRYSWAKMLDYEIKWKDVELTKGIFTWPTNMGQAFQNAKDKEYFIVLKPLAGAYAPAFIYTDATNPVSKVTLFANAIAATASLDVPVFWDTDYYQVHWRRWWNAVRDKLTEPLPDGTGETLADYCSGVMLTVGSDVTYDMSSLEATRNATIWDSGTSTSVATRRTNMGTVWRDGRDYSLAQITKSTTVIGHGNVFLDSYALAKAMAAEKATERQAGQLVSMITDLMPDSNYKHGTATYGQAIITGTHAQRFPNSYQSAANVVTAGGNLWMGINPWGSGPDNFLEFAAPDAAVQSAVDFAVEQFGTNLAAIEYSPPVLQGTAAPDALPWTNEAYARNAIQPAILSGGTALPSYPTVFRGVSTDAFATMTWEDFPKDSENIGGSATPEVNNDISGPPPYSTQDANDDGTQPRTQVKPWWILNSDKVGESMGHGNFSVTFFAFNPNNRKETFISGSSGLWHTLDGSPIAAPWPQWYPNVRGMGNSYARPVVTDPVDGNIVYTCTNEIPFFWSKDRLKTVRQSVALGSDSLGAPYRQMETAGFAIAVDQFVNPGTARPVYVASGLPARNGNGWVHMNPSPIDNIGSWNVIVSPGDVNTPVDPVFDANASGGLRTVGMKIIRDTTTGHKFLLAAVQSDTLIGGGIFRKDVTDNTAWVKCTTPTIDGYTPGTTSVEALGVMQRQITNRAQFAWKDGTTYVYLLDENTGVWRSSDYGLNWTFIYDSPTNTVRGTGFIAQHPTNNAILYLSNDAGVYKLTNAQTASARTGIIPGSTGGASATLTISASQIKHPGPMVSHINDKKLYVASRAIGTDPSDFFVSDVTADDATAANQLTWTSQSDAQYAAQGGTAYDLSISEANAVLYVSTFGSGIIVRDPAGTLTPFQQRLINKYSSKGSIVQGRSSISGTDTYTPGSSSSGLFRATMDALNLSEFSSTSLGTAGTAIAAATERPFAGAGSLRMSKMLSGTSISEKVYAQKNWTTPLVSFYSRFYFWLDAIPNSLAFLQENTNSTGNTFSYFGLTAGGIITVRMSGTPTPATQNLLTPTLATWYRLEMFHDFSNTVSGVQGRVTARIYSGASTTQLPLTGVTGSPTEYTLIQTTANAYSAGGITSTKWGHTNTGSTTGKWFFDSIGVNDVADGWLGP